MTTEAPAANARILAEAIARIDRHLQEAARDRTALAEPGRGWGPERFAILEMAAAVFMATVLGGVVGSLVPILWRACRPS